MEQLRQALEARDIDAVEAMLADDVVFRSPAVHRAYAGKPITTAVLRAAAQVFEDLHYVRTFTDDDGRGHVLMFEATIAGRQLEGIDMVTLDDAGLISEFRVMIRPMTGLQALADGMAPYLERALPDLGISRG